MEHIPLTRLRHPGVYIWPNNIGLSFISIHLHTQSLPSAKVKPPHSQATKKDTGKTTYCPLFISLIDFGKVPEADKICEVLVNCDTNIYSFLSFPYMETFVSYRGNSCFFLWKLSFPPMGTTVSL